MVGHAALIKYLTRIAWILLLMGWWRFALLSQGGTQSSNPHIVFLLWFIS